MNLQSFLPVIRAIAVLVFSLCITSCFDIPSEEEQEPEVSFPVATDLTNAEGNTLNVVITGRTSSEVTFFRSDDPEQTRFVYAIADLSPDTQDFINGLGIGGNNGIPLGQETTTAPKPLTADEKRLAWLREEIAREDSRLDEVQTRIKTAQTKSQRNGLYKDLERIKDKLVELKFEEKSLAEKLGEE